MSEFIVEELSQDQLAVAFPLVREVAPSLNIQRWKRFARRAWGDGHRPGRGILVIRRKLQPFPCGLACYRRDEDLAHSMVLTADYFVTMDLLDPASALKALMRELEFTARRNDCRAVRVLLHGAAPSALSGLLSVGHAREGSLLLKIL